MKYWLSVSALGLFLGCATTQVTNSWKNPDVKTPIHFNKIMVVAFAKDESTRRSAEDELVKFIGPDRALPSYSKFPLDDVGNVDKLKSNLQQSQVDGLVTIRPTDVKNEVNYTPGVYAAPYYSPYGYSNWAYSRVYDPGVMTVDTVVRIETNVYSIQQEKLVWSGVSETINPGDIKAETVTIAKALQKQLRKDGMISAPSN